jgi:hypothetical protein
MNRYCPVFLIESVSAIAAEKFILASTLPLDIFTKKLAEHLSKQYIEVNFQMLSKISENYLRVLSESNIDDADELLGAFVFNRINYFRRNGKKRSWGSAISNPSKGLKNLQFDIGLSRRNFRAFVYAYKNHAANTRSNGWNLEKFEHEEFIRVIADFEYSGFDFLN